MDSDCLMFFVLQNGSVHRAWFNGIQVQVLQGNFARSKLTMDAIRSMHADFRVCDLPDDTRYFASANSSNEKFELLEKVTINDSEPSGHLADLEFGGKGYTMYQPEGPTYV